MSRKGRPATNGADSGRPSEPKPGTASFRFTDERQRRVALHVTIHALLKSRSLVLYGLWALWLITLAVRSSPQEVVFVLIVGTLPPVLLYRSRRRQLGARVRSLGPDVVVSVDGPTLTIETDRSLQRFPTSGLASVGLNRRLGLLLVFADRSWVGVPAGCVPTGMVEMLRGSPGQRA